jgi:uncharacterized cupredoxin-like copper-binding protein
LRHLSTRLAACLAVPAAIGLIALSGCGGSDEVQASKLSMSVAEQGKQATFSVPKSVKGGLVDVSLTNKGEVPHQAQLILIEGNHSAQDVLNTVGGNSRKTPDWIRGEGGVGTVPPGKTATATVQMPAGNYMVADLGPASENGPPAYSTFKASEGDEGDLPDTSATVTAAEVGKDKFKWEGLDGLKAGQNTITFQSKGKDALHHITAIPETAGASAEELKKDLETENPKTPLDFEKASDTAVLDGGKGQVTRLDLKPGRYAFLCFLTDRDGGKEHFREGLLQTVTVK